MYYNKIFYTQGFIITNTKKHCFISLQQRPKTVFFYSFSNLLIAKSTNRQIGKSPNRQIAFFSN